MPREILICPKCKTHAVIKRGKRKDGTQKYWCQPCNHYCDHPLRPQDVLLLRRIVPAFSTLQGEQKKRKNEEYDTYNKSNSLQSI